MATICLAELKVYGELSRTRRLKLAILSPFTQRLAEFVTLGSSIETKSDVIN